MNADALLRQLKAKYRNPESVLRKLGLDEQLLAADARPALHRPAKRYGRDDILEIPAEAEIEPSASFSSNKIKTSLGIPNQIKVREEDDFSTDEEGEEMDNEDLLDTLIEHLGDDPEKLRAICEEHEGLREALDRRVRTGDRRHRDAEDRRRRDGEDRRHRARDDNFDPSGMLPGGEDRRQRYATDAAPDGLAAVLFTRRV